MSLHPSNGFQWTYSLPASLKGLKANHWYLIWLFCQSVVIPNKRIIVEACQLVIFLNCSDILTNMTLTSSWASDEPQIIKLCHSVPHQGWVVPQLRPVIVVVACIQGDQRAVLNVAQCHHLGFQYQWSSTMVFQRRKVFEIRPWIQQGGSCWTSNGQGERSKGSLGSRSWSARLDVAPAMVNNGKNYNIKGSLAKPGKPGNTKTDEFLEHFYMTPTLARNGTCVWASISWTHHQSGG